MTTHNENIVNNLQKRVITMKNGKIVDDQKNGGIYKLDDAQSVQSPQKTQRIIQTPGHALRQDVAGRLIRVDVTPATRPVAPKPAVPTNKPVASKPATPKPATLKPVVSMPKPSPALKTKSSAKQSTKKTAERKVI